MPSSPDPDEPPIGPRDRRGSGIDVSIAEAEARYHRERLALYKARVLSGRPTSLGRLRELERKAILADASARRLRDGPPDRR